MAKSKNTPNWGSVTSAASAMSNKDSASADIRASERQQRAQITLDTIKSREQDTRQLNQAHVEQLIESISVLGLLEPIVVDIRYRLLAGGHRFAALLQLRELSPALFDEKFADGFVPIRIMPFDAESQPNLALQCEIAENEHRRDYTKKEVRALATRLLDAGYVNNANRPKKGEKALVPALRVIVGKSRSSIMRCLSEEPQEKRINGESVPNDTLIIEQEKSALRQSFKYLKKLQDVLEQPRELSPKQEKLRALLPNLLNTLDKALHEISK